MDCSNRVDVITPVASLYESNVIQSEFKSLHAADEIFKNNRVLTQQNKEEMIASLSTAYHNFTKISAPSAEELKEASRLFYLFGRCLYGGNMDSSRKMFELSIAADLVSKNVLPKMPFLPTPLLQSLPGDLKNEALGDVDAWLMNTDQSQIVEFIRGAGDEDIFNFASNLRWLGHSFQNISNYQTAESLPRFEKIYGAAIAILETLKSEDATWEIGQILYNTTRFVHRLKCPGDNQGALQTLDKVFPYLEEEGATLRAAELQCQILNIQAIETEIPETLAKEESDKRKIFKLTNATKAMEIANQTEGFDPFLRTLFTNNTIGYGTSCLEAGLDVVTLDELLIRKDIVLSEIEKEKYNHYYHGIFLLNIAKFEVFCGNLKDATEHLSLVCQMSMKFPDHFHEFMNGAKEIMAKLTGKMQATAVNQTA